MFDMIMKYQLYGHFLLNQEVVICSLEFTSSRNTFHLLLQLQISPPNLD